MSRSEPMTFSGVDADVIHFIDVKLPSTICVPMIPTAVFGILLIILKSCIKLY